ncbi:hypothetical protein F4703DRAFT_1797463 [Phycomyces blakesleeanus]
MFYNKDLAYIRCHHEIGCNSDSGGGELLPNGKTQISTFTIKTAFLVNSTTFFFGIFFARKHVDCLLSCDDSHSFADERRECRRVTVTRELEAVYNMQEFKWTKSVQNAIIPLNHRNWEYFNY